MKFRTLRSLPTTLTIFHHGDQETWLAWKRLNTACIQFARPDGEKEMEWKRVEVTPAVGRFARFEKKVVSRLDEIENTFYYPGKENYRE